MCGFVSLSPNANSDNANNEFNVNTDGNLNNNNARNSNGVRPAVYLTSSLSLSGSGTQSDPFTIVS